MAIQESDSSQIVKRLDILIALALNSTSSANDVSISSKIKTLAALGINPAEIGRILGKPGNYVSAVLGSKKGRK